MTSKPEIVAKREMLFGDLYASWTVWPKSWQEELGAEIINQIFRSIGADRQKEHGVREFTMYRLAGEEDA